jgi:hypothetical protein
MTSNRPDPDSWNDTLETARRKVKDCRESIDNATEAAAKHPEKAEWFRRYAAKKRLEVVNVALDVCDLQDRLAPRTQQPTDGELREHERRLGLPEGTFWRNVREPVPGATIWLRRGLEQAKELAEEELRQSDPLTFDLDYGPAIIRVCCATVVGALVGAPLGALAIHESVLEKMYEAAIVTGLSAIAAEIAGPLSELARRPDELPAEPAPASSLSGIDAVIDEVLNLEGPPGRLPDLDDDLRFEPPPPGQSEPPEPGGPSRL